ncbi:MAG: magnesium transporter [Chloroflexi bacterium]|nr:magnesium transporter [Chloroflexota bacterium]
MQRLSVDEARDRLSDALDAGADREVARLVPLLPSHDVERLLPELDARRLGVLFRAMGDEWLASVVSELDPGIAARLLVRLTDVQAADVLEEMPPDEAADVVGELREEAREEVLAEMEREEAADIRELLEYPPETAGGRMTPEFAALRDSMTVDDALQFLRRAGKAADAVFYLYVTDDGGRLAGVTTLRDLVLSPGSRLVAEITKREVVSVQDSDDQEHAARVLRESGFLAVPVLGPDRRMLGLITADDVAEVIEEEASEDIERLGGSQPLEEPYLTASLWHLFRKRILWLLVLFAAHAYTGNVLQHYQGEVAVVVALVVFIPLLIGTGGNTGSQVVTTLVRAIAVGEVQMRDIFRVFTRELVVGSMLALAMGIVAFVRALTLGVGPGIAEVVALTAFCIVTWSALVASVLPLLLKRVGLDPAVASGPFIATVVDGTGLVIYFSIAKVLLGI